MPQVAEGPFLNVKVLTGLLQGWLNMYYHGYRWLGWTGKRKFETVKTKGDEAHSVYQQIQRMQSLRKFRTNLLVDSC